MCGAACDARLRAVVAACSKLPECNRPRARKDAAQLLLVSYQRLLLATVDPDPFPQRVQLRRHVKLNVHRSPHTWRPRSPASAPRRSYFGQRKGTRS
jgi:hypothetical protein